jgi:6-phosphofructokinase 1
MKIGILTAGGDAPGLNAAIRAITLRGLRDGHDVVGISNGFSGLITSLQGRHLGSDDVEGIVATGGTILGTSRVNVDTADGGREGVLNVMTANFDAVIAIGGDGTHRLSSWFAAHGAPLVGVPKTLDNDLTGTDYCIGFDTAVSIVAEAIDRLQTTAASHHRVMVVETMGRETGWVAACGALAGGADCVLVPEFPQTLDDLVAHIDQRHRSGYAYSLVVVAEGVTTASLGGAETIDSERDELGRVRLTTRGIAHYLSAEIERRGVYDVRPTVLGHVQRGGTPTSFDRQWSTRVALEAYHAATRQEFGTISVVRGNAVTVVPLTEVVASPRPLPRELYDLVHSVS